MTFAAGVIVGIVWAYAPWVLVVVLVTWRERRARRNAIEDLLSRAAVLHD